MLNSDAAEGNESMSAETADLLQGARVLVLEDETLVSMMVEDMLMDLGCEIVGPFARLDQAMAFVDGGGEIDLALLDVNLGGERSFPLAEKLSGLNIPFVFTTGYDESGMPDSWRGRPSLRKPFMMHEMAAVLRSAIAP
jgi:two-component SAPR family response regulator